MCDARLLAGSAHLCNLHIRTKMEYRGAVRYRLGAPAVFSWKGAKGSRLQGEGLTRDISSNSAFLISPTSPPADTTIQVDIFLPPLHNGSPRVRIQAEALVVRIESSDKTGCGFAVMSVPGFNFAHLSLGDAKALSSMLAKKLEEAGESADE